MSITIYTDIKLDFNQINQILSFSICTTITINYLTHLQCLVASKTSTPTCYNSGLPFYLFYLIDCDPLSPPRHYRDREDHRDHKVQRRQVTQRICDRPITSLQVWTSGHPRDTSSTRDQVYGRTVISCSRWHVGCVHSQLVRNHFHAYCIMYEYGNRWVVRDTVLHSMHRHVQTNDTSCRK